jgi:hypothetical protein
LGCGLLGVLMTLFLPAVLGVRAWDRWQVDGYGENVDQAGWQQPADGVLLEPRLEAFVQIRREIHEHYSRDLAGLSPGQVFRMLLRPYVLRRAEAAAQARVGMGDREYFWTMVTVIRALGAPASRPGGSGGPPHLVVATAQLQTEAAFRAARIDEEERARWKALWDSDEAPPENVELVGRYREEIARLAVPPALLVVE